MALFLSTLSLRRATGELRTMPRVYRISIHALLAESDHNRHRFPHHCRDFYPRSPCGERRYWGTRSWRLFNFYPRSPCGERRGHCRNFDRDQQFLSTLSLRRATYNLVAGSKAKSISIHALLAESDQRTLTSALYSLDFYPRSPCGERLNSIIDIINNVIFLSTLSLRRATWADTSYNLSDIISIHALLAESDQPRKTEVPGAIISIHALLAESDGKIDTRRSIKMISIHALLAESDL